MTGAYNGDPLIVAPNLDADVAVATHRLHDHGNGIVRLKGFPASKFAMAKIQNTIFGHPGLHLIAPPVKRSNVWLVPLAS